MSNEARFEALTPRKLKLELQRRLHAREGYNAFISHAHDPDAAIAHKIEKRLEGWARPALGGRAMRVFRDTSKMTASPGLRTSITTALDESDWLIVLLSPNAASSDWVDEEISHWLEHRDSQRILLVHTHGHLAWDRSLGDISNDSDCVPSALRGGFSEMPRYVDFSGLEEQRWSVRRSRLRIGIRDLATQIHGIPADALEGAHRSTERTARAGIAGLLVLLVTAVAFSLMAGRQGRLAGEASVRADEEAALGNASAAAGRALDLYAEDIDIGLLMAVEAWSYRDVPETRAAMAAGLVHHRHLEQVIRPEGTPHRIGLSPDETKLATFTLEQRLQVWDLNSGTQLSEGFIDVLVEKMTFDHEGERLAIVSSPIDPTAPNQVQVRPVGDLETVETTVDLGAGPFSMAFAGSDVLVAFTSGVDAIGPDGSSTRLLDLPVSGMAVDAGQTLVIGTQNETEHLIQIYDVSSGSADGLVELTAQEPVTAVGLSPDGQEVSYVTGGSLGFWSRDEELFGSSVESFNGVAKAVPAANVFGTTALFADGTVVTWTWLSGELTSFNVLGKSIVAPPETGLLGLRVASIGDRLVSIWRTDRAFPIAQPVLGANLMGLEGEPLIRHVDFGPDDTRLVVAETDGLSLLATDDWRVLDSVDELGICAATISQDGASVWTLEVPPGEPSEIRQRSALNLSEVLSAKSIDLDECGLGLDISRDGLKYAVDATLYDATGVELASGGVTSIDNALSEKAAALSWTSMGSEESGPLLRILDVATGEVTKHSTDQPLWGISQGPDGVLAAGVVRGQDEGAISVWNSGHELLLSVPRPYLGDREPLGEDPIVALAFTADGSRLAAGGWLGSLLIWDVAPELLALAACDVANRTLTDAELVGVFSEASLGFASANPCETHAETTTTWPPVLE